MHSSSLSLTTGVISRFLTTTSHPHDNSTSLEPIALLISISLTYSSKNSALLFLGHILFDPLHFCCDIYIPSCESTCESTYVQKQHKDCIVANRTHSEQAQLKQTT